MGNNPKSSSGVCTRAKTLALKKLELQPASSSTADPHESAANKIENDGGISGGDYLQLRSRRLERVLAPAVVAGGKIRKKGCKKRSSNAEKKKVKIVAAMAEKQDEMMDYNFLSVVGKDSLGHNLLNNLVECGERASGEITPPPSVNAITTAPALAELNEFFELAEEKQRKDFIAKYNFDFKNERPLPGRYEWEKINP